MLRVSSWRDWCLALLESVLTVFCTAFLHFALHFCISRCIFAVCIYHQRMVNDGKVLLHPAAWIAEIPFAVSVPHGYHRIKISFTHIEEIDAVNLPFSAYKATKHKHLWPELQNRSESEKKTKGDVKIKQAWECLRQWCFFSTSIFYGHVVSCEKGKACLSKCHQEYLLVWKSFRKRWQMFILMTNLCCNSWKTSTV